jgi:hypothetical protein
MNLGEVVYGTVALFILGVLGVAVLTLISDAWRWLRRSVQSLRNRP